MKTGDKYAGWAIWLGKTASDTLEEGQRRRASFTCVQVATTLSRSMVGSIWPKTVD